MPHRKVVPERGFPYSQGGIVDIESRLISLCIIVWCNSPLPTILCLSLTPFQVCLSEASSLSRPLKSCLSLKCLNRKHCKHVAFSLLHPVLPFCLSSHSLPALPNSSSCGVKNCPEEANMLPLPGCFASNAFRMLLASFPRLHKHLLCTCNFHNS